MAMGDVKAVMVVQTRRNWRTERELSWWGVLSNNQLLLISSFFVSKLFIPCFLFQVFGNHEFDNGVEGLMKPFLEQIKCPILSANIKPDHTLNATFGITYLPYKIFTIGREKVGVVGYTTQETPALSKPGKWLLWANVKKLPWKLFNGLLMNKYISGCSVFLWKEVTGIGNWDHALIWKITPQHFHED